ncbi:hypothetical protein AGMMS49940_21910 [Spirochaetia bacterium]|nr:hypothetical protein AGMMS49940_21910 [Spirochaetia bacterium]
MSEISPFYPKYMNYPIPHKKTIAGRENNAKNTIVYAVWGNKIM